MMSIFMSDDPVKSPQVVCSAFVERNGKFLLFFCPRFKVWRLPGGRAEYSETLEETVVRELKEELGLSVKNPKFVGWAQDHQYHVRDRLGTSRLLMFFHVKIRQEPVIDSDEAEKYAWLQFAQLKKLRNKEGALTTLLRQNPRLGKLLG